MATTVVSSLRAPFSHCHTAPWALFSLCPAAPWGPVATRVALPRTASSTAARGMGVRAQAWPTYYKVKLITPDDGAVNLEVPEDVYILDHAEELGINVIPYSCRAGSCCACVGKIVSGTVDQSEQTFLDDDMVEEGFVLTCCASPTSDLVIETHKEEELTQAANTWRDHPQVSPEIEQEEEFTGDDYDEDDDDDDDREEEEPTRVAPPRSASSSEYWRTWYKVKLITSEREYNIEVPDDVYILDHAEELGIELAHSCRAGSCSTCAGKLISGTVDQSNQSFLDDEQMEAGWVLTCHAYPTSDDIVIEANMEEYLTA